MKNNRSDDLLLLVFVIVIVGHIFGIEWASHVFYGMFAICAIGFVFYIVPVTVYVVIIEPLYWFYYQYWFFPTRVQIKSFWYGAVVMSIMLHVMPSASQWIRIPFIIACYTMFVSAGLGIIRAQISSKL